MTATTVALAPETVEQLAARLAELLTSHLTEQPSAPNQPGRLLSAAEVSDWWGVSRGWVYEHATELGAVRIGDGERPRLRFDPHRVAERLDQLPPSRQAAPQPARSAWRSQRIRRDPQRLAFRADPELTSRSVNN